MDGNWFSDWSDEWHDPACINGDYGSWDFDDGMPPAVPGAGTRRVLNYLISMHRPYLIKRSPVLTHST